MEQQNLKSEEAQLHMTIQVTRKDTGKVEEYHLVGTASPIQADEPEDNEE